MRWRWWWQPPCLLQRVIVNFKHHPEEAIEGVLWGYRWGWLTLRDTTGLRSGREPAKVAGEIVVHRSAIAFMQVVPS